MEKRKKNLTALKIYHSEVNVLYNACLSFFIVFLSDVARLPGDEKGLLRT